MKNFKLIMELDVAALRADIYKYQDLFAQPDQDLKEGDIGFTHKDAQLILCRYPPINALTALTPEGKKEIEDNLFSQWYSSWIAFKPILKPLLYSLMHAVDGTHLGGVGIVKLPAGKRVTMHCDEGMATKFYRRFHITVDGPEECFFICGEERVAMRDGEVWWFDCTKPHGVENHDSRDRISVSVDIGVM